MAARILTYHQVMPAYLDFMLIFGAQEESRDLRFSGFREQTLLRDPPAGVVADELGRSGRQFQLCYNLAGVTNSKLHVGAELKYDQWSIRQAAIHHQFDVVHGTTLWIVTKGRKDLQQLFKELTGKDGRSEDKTFGSVYECLRSSFAAHLLFCNWATHDWRWYISWLERIFETEVSCRVFRLNFVNKHSQTTLAVVGRRGPEHARREYKVDDIQDLQSWLEKTNEAIMVLEANIEVVSSLQRYYRALAKRRDFPPTLKDRCRDDITAFLAHLDEVVCDFKSHTSRAKLLASSIRDRKELVSYLPQVEQETFVDLCRSQIQQHIHGQASERTMRLNHNMERDAAIMQIITVVTLIYLPATFTSVSRPICMAEPIHS